MAATTFQGAGRRRCVRMVATASLCQRGRSEKMNDHVMPLPGGSGSQDLFDDFGAELAGGQHEDRLKAEVIEIGLEKRSACVFEVR